MAVSMDGNALLRPTRLMVLRVLDGNRWVDDPVPRLLRTMQDSQ